MKTTHIALAIAATGVAVSSVFGAAAPAEAAAPRLKGSTVKVCNKTGDVLSVGGHVGLTGSWVDGFFVRPDGCGEISNSKSGTTRDLSLDLSKLDGKGIKQSYPVNANSSIIGGWVNVHHMRWNKGASIPLVGEVQAGWFATDTMDYVWGNKGQNASKRIANDRDGGDIEVQQETSTDGKYRWKITVHAWPNAPK